MLIPRNSLPLPHHHHHYSCPSQSNDDISGASDVTTDQTPMRRCIHTPGRLRQQLGWPSSISWLSFWCLAVTVTFPWRPSFNRDVTGTQKVLEAIFVVLCLAPPCLWGLTLLHTFTHTHSHTHTQLSVRKQVSTSIHTSSHTFEDKQPIWLHYWRFIFYCWNTDTRLINNRLPLYS